MIDVMGEFGPEQFLCFMYYSDHATDYHEDRWRYYQGYGIPHCQFNGYRSFIGADPSGTTSDIYKDIVEEELLRPSVLRMSVELEITGSNGTVTGQIEALDSVPEALINVVIYEDPGPVIPHVSRAFAVYQQHLTALEAGQIQDVAGDFIVGSDWTAEDLHAVMFVQSAYASHGILPVVGLGPGPDNHTEAGILHSHYHSGSEFDFFRWQQFPAYSVDSYGLNVACGDLDADGFDEIITGPGPGTIFGPHVRAFEIDSRPVAGINFLAYGTNKYGVNVASGDLNGDGYDEIITGAGPGAVFGPHVRGWDCSGTSGAVAMSGINFFAYGTPKWGVNVAAGDMDGDGMDEIITGAGPGAVYGPHVRGWNYDGVSLEAIPGVSFLAYGTNKFGVNVAAGDIDRDGYDEIITGAGPGAVFGPHVRAWNVDGGVAQPIGGMSFFAFDYDQWGVYVGCGDVIGGDGRYEILVGPGPGPDDTFGSRGRIYSTYGSTPTLTHEFIAFTGSTSHGLKVAAGHIGEDVPE